MGIVIDIILVAVVVIAVILSAKKGIIVTLLEVVAFIAAVFLASQCAAPVASGMYTAFFQKNVQRGLYDVLPENPAGLTYAQKAQYVVDSIPDFANDYAEKVGINISTISEKISKCNFANNDELYLSLESEIVKPIAVAVLKNIMFFVLAVLFAVILAAIAKSIGKGFKKTKILGSADKLVGGILGVIKGVVVVFLLCFLLTYLEPKLSNDSVKEAVRESSIVAFAEDFDPMEAITAAGVFAEQK